MQNQALDFYFLAESTLEERDFNEDIEFILDGLLAKNMMTLIYADGGNGKSWLAFALAKHCANQGLRTVYCDFDNPLSVLKERNINELLVNQCHNLQYIQRGKCPHTPQELLAQLNERAIGNAYENWVIFIDSLRNFGNVNNDGQINHIMTQLMNLREAGATIVVLHHSNKDGNNYKGSSDIRNSVDNMLQLSKLKNDSTSIDLHLVVTKERCSIVNGAYKVNTQTLAIQQLNELEATMTEEIEEFIAAIKQSLNDMPNMNKTELLKSVGRKKDNKPARRWLDQFDGMHWVSKKAGGVMTYELKNGSSKSE